MVASIVFCFASGYQAKSKVLIIPQSESAFVLRDRELDIVARQSVIESKPQERSGFVLVRQSDDDEKDVAMAAKELEQVSISLIAKRQPGGKILIWNESGAMQPESLGLLNDSEKDLLKEGETAVRISQPIDHDHRFFRVSDYGLHNTSYRQEGSIRNEWIFIGKQTTRFVNIALWISGNREVGSISSEVGTTAKIGDATFLVEAIPVGFEDSQDRSRKVKVVFPRSGRGFFVEPKMSEGSSLPNLRNSTSVQEISKKDDPFRTQMFSIQSSALVKDWPTIKVSEVHRLFGYFSHVSLKPALSIH